MELKGSQTEKNLWAAFAGESQARNKYTYYASKAKKDGFVQISNIFQETADNEKEHAKIWFKLVQGIGDTADNLKDAAAGEHDEWTSMYPGFAKTAREEGFERIAKLFEGVAAIERAGKYMLIPVGSVPWASVLSILTAVSFFVGMIFARAYAEKVLHCRYLFHLADKRIDPEANSRTRPDFYGESKKGPFLIEAKGTSKARVDNLTIKHASEQLAGIRSVNGISANDIDKYTIATSFVSGRNGRVLTQSVVDPVGAFEEDINFDLDKAAYYYYEGITSLFEDPAIQQVRFSSHLGYVFVDLDDFMIGIEEDVLNLMRNVNPVTPDGCYYKLRRALDSGSSLAKQAFASGPAKGKRVEQYSVGGDGLIFEIVNDQL